MHVTISVTAQIATAIHPEINMLNLNRKDILAVLAWKLKTNFQTSRMRVHLPDSLSQSPMLGGLHCQE
jgi:hypothetical protein